MQFLLRCFLQTWCQSKLCYSVSCCFSFPLIFHWLFPPIFQWSQQHCCFHHSIHQEQHCGLGSTLPRLITAPRLAPWRLKTRWKVALCRYYIVNRITSSTHQSSLSWKSRPWSTPLLGCLRWQGRDLIRTINTRKWLPWASVLSVHVMKRSSVPAFFFSSFLEGATWQNLTKSRLSKMRSRSREPNKSEQKSQQPSG